MGHIKHQALYVTYTVCRRLARAAMISCAPNYMYQQTHRLRLFTRLICSPACTSLMSIIKSQYIKLYLELFVITLCLELLEFAEEVYTQNNTLPNQ